VSVAEQAPNRVFINSRGRVVYANQRYAQLLGYDAPEDREFIKSYARMREQGKDAPTSCSYHGLRRDGTTIPLHATISTYRSLGHLLAFVREVEPGSRCHPQGVCGALPVDNRPTASILNLYVGAVCESRQRI